MVVSILTSCSPVYVMRAGWEEAGILLRRKKISKLLESSKTDETLKHKFRLVLEARKFASSIGLEPKGSFSKYSEIDRDVLIWVLSGSSKTSLTPVTWWFPIVGRVPYKGFFEKEDGVGAARKLQQNGYDIYLRPSAAFSTLGWFDDPLLSTVLKFDDVSLVNTVLHELLHNTVWIPNNVSFNETLANVVGSLAAQEFFARNLGPESTEAVSAGERWHDELLYARFLAETSENLRAFYSSLNKKTQEKDQDANQESSEKILEKREELFESARVRWSEKLSELKTDRFIHTPQKLNNAVILAQEVYLNRPWLFVDLYDASAGSLENFIDEIRIVEKNIKREGGNPFEAITERITKLRQQSKDYDIK